METKAFELVAQGKLKEATALLLSPEYEGQKQIYASGLTKTIDGLQSYVNSNLKEKSQLTISALITIAIGSSILLFVWILVLRRMQKYVLALDDCYSYQTRGNYFPTGKFGRSNYSYRRPTG
jgi:hypothetical protein